MSHCKLITLPKVSNLEEQCFSIYSTNCKFLGPKYHRIYTILRLHVVSIYLAWKGKNNNNVCVNSFSKMFLDENFFQCSFIWKWTLYRFRCMRTNVECCKLTLKLLPLYPESPKYEQWFKWWMRTNVECAAN